MHQQNFPMNSTKRLNGIMPPPGVLEPMAKDLVDEEIDDASDCDMETSLCSSTATSSTSSLLNINTVAYEKSINKSENNADLLPSIEELTKSMQDLTDRDVMAHKGEDNLSMNTVCPQVPSNCALGDGFPIKSNLHSVMVKANPSEYNQSIRDNDTDVLTENEVIGKVIDSKKCELVNTPKESRDIFKNKDEMDIKTSIVEEKQTHQNIETNRSLQNEIDKLLAPLSSDISREIDDLQVQNVAMISMCGTRDQPNLGFDMDHHQALCHTPKNSPVTRSNTKDNVLKMVFSADEAETLLDDDYNQNEKRARLASICSTSSSSCSSSSPFELCNVEEGTTPIVAHALIESAPSGKDKTTLIAKKQN